VRPYADTNFLVRLYLDLPGTDDAVDLVRGEVGGFEAGLPVGWLHRVELMNALLLYVFLSRQGRGPRVTREMADAAHASFRADLKSNSFLRASDVGVSELETGFEQLALRHTASHGFRTYDLLHVAGALLSNCDEFWSFDTKARKLAELEGLSVSRISW